MRAPSKALGLIAHPERQPPAALVKNIVKLLCKQAHVGAQMGRDKGQARAHGVSEEACMGAMGGAWRCSSRMQGGRGGEARLDGADESQRPARACSASAGTQQT